MKNTFLELKVKEKILKPVIDEEFENLPAKVKNLLTNHELRILEGNLLPNSLFWHILFCFFPSLKLIRKNENSILNLYTKFNSEILFSEVLFLKQGLLGLYDLKELFELELFLSYLEVLDNNEIFFIRVFDDLGLPKEKWIDFLIEHSSFIHLDSLLRMRFAHNLNELFHEEYSAEEVLENCVLRLLEEKAKKGKIKSDSSIDIRIVCDRLLKNEIDSYGLLEACLPCVKKEGLFWVANEVVSNLFGFFSERIVRAILGYRGNRLRKLVESFHFDFEPEPDFSSSIFAVPWQKFKPQTFQSRIINL